MAQTEEPQVETTNESTKTTAEIIQEKKAAVKVSSKEAKETTEESTKDATTEESTKDATTEESTKDATTEESTKELTAEEALSLLAQGNRNLHCGEVATAVTQLEEACRILAAKHGETSDLVADAYYSYGSALLDMSRIESGVLGNALQGIDEDTENSADESADEQQVENPDKVTGEEREKIEDEVIDAMTEEREVKKDPKTEESNGEAKVENGATNGTSNGHTNGEEKTNGETKEEKTNGEQKEAKTNGKAKAEDTNGKTEETNGDEKMDTDNPKDEESSEDKAEDEKEGTDVESEDLEESAEEAKTEEEGDDPKEGGSKEPEDDVSNLQLAWEMLELSKIIFSRGSSKEMKLKAADAYLKLGEVGLETEQYDQAIGDLKSCLKIQKEHLDAESRRIAETHYQIGLACCFCGQYDDSISNYKSAVTVLESKIAQLQAVVDGIEKRKADGEEISVFDDTTLETKKEMSDLSELLPDIKAKIEDTIDEQNSQEKVKKLVKENVAAEKSGTTVTVGFGEQSSTEAAPITQTKSASDITHLVRKKRKQDEDESADETTKKAKVEEKETEKKAKVEEKETEKKAEEKTVEKKQEKEDEKMEAST